MIQIAERVQLHGFATPRALDASPERRRETRRLADIAFYDFVIHVRDPLLRECRQQKGLSGFGCTRKAGSRHRISGT
jgi:hypothetical protein